MNFDGEGRAVAQAAGWDFLGTLDNALVPLAAPPPPEMDPDSWLKTGRAFDFARITADAGWVAGAGSPGNSPRTPGTASNIPKTAAGTPRFRIP